MKDLSSGSKYLFSRAVVFDKECYPGYENKKVNIKGSFPIFDAKTYVFTADNEGKEEEEEGTIEGKSLNDKDLINVCKESNTKKVQKNMPLCRSQKNRVFENKSLNIWNGLVVCNDDVLDEVTKAMILD